MMFDETFPDDAVGCTSRFDSAPYDEHRQADAMPTLAPVSPCYSKESAASSAADSITGTFSDIDHSYYINPKVLGSGHHGSVRECVDRTTGRRHAVKSVRKSDPAVKPGALAREIALLKEMKHQSIVRLVDVHEDAEYVHLVTDLCEGGELFDRIVARSCDEDKAHACFAEDEAAGIIYQILAAVSYMHARGVVHRDLKPENVLFETAHDDSPIRIIDFGLSRKHRRAHYEPPMSTVAGTPYYIAPEVLRRSYDKSCDLWSVGVIAYILLCGYPPFTGFNSTAVHAAVLRGRYCFRAEEWAGTSGEARNFVQRLLRRDPRKRMSAEQALDHPWVVQWIVNHVDTSVTANDADDQRGVSSVEDLFLSEVDEGFNNMW